MKNKQKKECNKVWNCRFHPFAGWHEVGCPHKVSPTKQSEIREEIEKIIIREELPPFPLLPMQKEVWKNSRKIVIDQLLSLISKVQSSTREEDIKEFKEILRTTTWKSRVSADYALGLVECKEMILSHLKTIEKRKKV